MIRRVSAVTSWVRVITVVPAGIFVPPLKVLKRIVLDGVRSGTKPDMLTPELTTTVFSIAVVRLHTALTRYELGGVTTNWYPSKAFAPQTAGFFPARAASKLKPVDALRYE